MGKRNGGFSLIETLISIVILGAMVVPTCTALVMSIRLNDKTEKMLQAQLAVSSAVETLMAEGMTGVYYDETNNTFSYQDNFDDVTVTVTDGQIDVYYNVVVMDDNAIKKEDGTTEPDPLVVVETTIRAADNTPASEPTGGDGE